MKQFLFRLLATLVVVTVLAAPAIWKWWPPAVPITAPAPVNDEKADPAQLRELSDTSRHVDSVQSRLI